MMGKQSICRICGGLIFAVHTAYVWSSSKSFNLERTNNSTVVASRYIRYILLCAKSDRNSCGSYRHCWCEPRPSVQQMDFPTFFSQLRSLKSKHFFMSTVISLGLLYFCMLTSFGHARVITQVQWNCLHRSLKYKRSKIYSIYIIYIHTRFQI